MGALFLELLPSALGLAITPTAIAACILFLNARRPVADALSFAASFAIVYSAIAIVILFAVQSAEEPLVDERTKNWTGFGVGVFLLLTAAFIYFRGRRPVMTATAVASREPRWMAAIGSASPKTAFSIGLLVAVLNPNVPILIAGLSVDSAAEVSPEARMSGAAFLILASLTGMLVPILWFVLRRESAERGLARLRAWLSRHDRQLNIGVLVVFGLVFTIKGVVELAR